MNENATPIVPHPRYGDKPRASGCDEAVAAARKQWGGETFREWVFPESAILADPSHQNCRETRSGAWKQQIADVGLAESDDLPCGENLAGDLGTRGIG